MDYELVPTKYSSRQDQHTTALGLGQAQVLSGIAEEQSEQSTGK
jgi:hypothetical protein